MDRAAEQPPVKVFINYRRSETAGDARALFDRFAAHFGAENVFLDVASLEPGTKWLDDIKKAAISGVFVTLIGRRWDAIMDERARRRLIDPEEDYVRVELEAALRKGSGVHVIPVLIDDAVMPSAEQLSPSLRALASYNATSVRHSRWEDDVEVLVERIEEIARERPAPPEPRPRRVIAAPVAAPDADGGEPAAPPPPASHFDMVARFLGEGSIVPFLGAGINAGDRNEPWQDGSGLPDADELSNHLARVFNVAAREQADLAHVSQDVYLGMGKSDLFKTLRRVLTSNCEPTSVHRFLARLPALLGELGVYSRYQLIVTTNYDDALERAFDAEQEPYDVAVYMATGEYDDHSVTFLHLPFEGEGWPIHVRNK